MDHQEIIKFQLTKIIAKKVQEMLIQLMR